MMRVTAAVEWGKRVAIWNLIGRARRRKSLSHVVAFPCTALVMIAGHAASLLTIDATPLSTILITKLQDEKARPTQLKQLPE